MYSLGGELLKKHDNVLFILVFVWEKDVKLLKIKYLHNLGLKKNLYLSCASHNYYNLIINYLNIILCLLKQN